MPPRTSLKSRPPKIIRDHLSPMPSHLLTTTLNDLLRTPSSSSSSPSSTTGHILPQGHHLVYFPLQTPASNLAPDGADKDHAPNEEFTRRLWAGGEVRFHNSKSSDLVLDGRPWLCREEIGDVRVKGDEQGPGSEKVFVDVWRRYALGHDENPGKWDIEERRTLVFMRKADDEAGDVPPKGRLVRYAHTPTHSAALTPTPAHLFHFSALTYNAHAIHLDPGYARSQDGHRALLVHGPLSLALMLRVLNDHLNPSSKSHSDGGGIVKSIVYRNYAPLYVGEEMKVCVKPAKRGAARDEREEEWDVWVEGPEGGLAVKGSVVVDTKRDNL
ncbi:hypothetical protein M440DRAFT_1472732 [Trichoderma longibrachiatum ATCC 18648]|uniref:Thioesterase/thiol ester dehydrase-isomerase n=1 Tax=Trichoderma longibrachiatum ATCC 18648 TaxID=983965 RepID=A0A2T4BU90_TRILO|nr:hypothetical protein M440DRAFT_1472732 [Trichoderma longibrachiatum ATCC 18648]